ncbi:MAG: creatinine amidohydrolase [Pirellulaceae bacterium]|jgi:creatinine amidohydrolase
MKFQEMTSPQLAAIDRQNTLVIVPIAAVEQHGPHLPTGTDNIICTAIADAVESRCSAKVLATPTMWYGASAHHLRLGATLSSELDNFIATLCGLTTNLLEDGFRRILFLNGHGGNVDPLQVALRKMQPVCRTALLAGGSYWATAADFIGDALDGDHKFVGHACEFETSMIMHLRPELVDTDKLANAGVLVSDRIAGLFLSRDMKHRTQSGCTGRPDLASAEKGSKLFAGIVDRVEAAVHALLDQPLGEVHADFLANQR